MDKKAYIIAKSSAESYTDQALDGVGALKGDPCQIDSITPSPDGTHSTVVFKWVSNSGVEYTSSLDVMNGKGIKSLDIDNFGHLITTFDDNTTKDSGEMPVETVEVGDTTTVDYEEGADVTSTPTPTGISLDFQIPRGQPGTSDPVWDVV